MHTLQLAAESYCTDTAGQFYPAHFAQLLPYLPGGANLPNSAAGVTPGGCVFVDLTPDTLSVSEGHCVVNQKRLKQQLAAIDENVDWVGYCQFANSYVIIGGEGLHLAAGNAGRPLILSNG